jgi:plastocyanin
VENEETDQEKFDEQVNKTGKGFLEIAAGVGVVAALVMSLVALMVASNKSDSSARVVAAAPSGRLDRLSTVGRTLAAGPRSATIMIDHVTRGCHTLDVNGSGRLSPRATIHLAAGGVLHMQNNDVMPHALVLARGRQATLAGAAMGHMGAKSTVTFPAAGKYSLTTKAGNDYQKGVTTTGPDNTLRITVIVAA